MIGLGILLAAPAALPAAEVIAPQAGEARRLTAPINFDGRLDEQDWKNAKPLDRFFEAYPRSRVTAPEHTEARFLYDERYLYVGFRMMLRDPSRLRKPFVRRDRVGSTHDYVQVYLDPQGSGQASTLFRINARGSQTDGVSDEAKQTEITDPDFAWDVRTAVAGQGWTAEVRIPLSTLRVSKRGAQTWNVIVTRGVPRDQNTQMATAPWPSDASCFLCLASKLAFADLRPKAERLILEPTLVGSIRRDTGKFGSGTHLDVEPSLDAKWLPYGGAAVDLTINPDFSQVESDTPQLTANQRFAINFPEKRPFFREGLDLITTPLPILYTRTIAAPDYGFRFTHRSATINGTSFIARDGGRAPITEPGLLSSSSASPDFDSSVGFAHVTDRFGNMLASVLGAARINADGSYNWVGGADAAWQSSTDRLTGQLLASFTRNPDRPELLNAWRGQRLSGTAAIAEWAHTASLVSTLRFTHYSPGFRSWLGFVPRVAYNEFYAFLQKPFYLHTRLVTRFAPYVTYDRLDGIGIEGRELDAGLGVRIDGIKSLGFDASWHPLVQYLTEQGEERRMGQFRWTASIQPSARLAVLALSGTIGRDVDYDTGDVVPLTRLSATVRTRPLDWLELEARYSLLRLGGGPDRGFRVKETIPEFLATWYFGPAFYAFGDLQLRHAERRFPSIADTRSHLATLQLVWEPSIVWRGYLGIRSGKTHPLNPAGRGTSNEFYVKVTRRLTV